MDWSQRQGVGGHVPLGARGRESFGNHAADRRLRELGFGSTRERQRVSGLRAHDDRRGCLGVANVRRSDKVFRLRRHCAASEPAAFASASESTSVSATPESTSSVSAPVAASVAPAPVAAFTTVESAGTAQGPAAGGAVQLLRCGPGGQDDFVERNIVALDGRGRTRCVRGGRVVLRNRLRTRKQRVDSMERAAGRRECRSVPHERRDVVRVQRQLSSSLVGGEGGNVEHRGGGAGADKSYETNDRVWTHAASRHESSRHGRTQDTHEAASCWPTIRKPTYHETRKEQQR